MVVLFEITEISDLQKLRDMYRIDWPEHCVGYYCLNNFLNWKRENKIIKNLTIYSSTCEEGLYVIIDRYQLFLGSLNKASCENLTKALMSLDWSKGFKVSSFLERHRPAVLDTVNSKKLNIEYDSLTLRYYLPNSEAKLLQVSCPKGFILKPLCSATDTDIVNSLWPHRHDGSFLHIKRLIDWNINMGIYVEATNELVAWCLRWQGGFLGALQVKENYKRLGLGTAVTQAISRRIAEQGDDVMALVFEENLPSRRVFENCPKGFILKPLCSATDADIINSLWPNRHDGSLFFIKRSIDWNINMGIYVEGTNELVAWCIRLQGGFLGALQVKENFKRLGLGSAVTQAISRRIADQGDDVMALVSKENLPSRRVFEKLNFRIMDNCYWLKSYPTIDSYSWPEGE